MNGAERIAAERARQVAEEKWTAEHDADHHRQGELARAAIFYADPSEFLPGHAGPGHKGPRIVFLVPHSEGFSTRDVAPWRGIETKRAAKDRVSRLVIAGALIAAEIDRLTVKLEEPRRCGDCGDLIGRCECN